MIKVLQLLSTLVSNELLFPSFMSKVSLKYQLDLWILLFIDQKVLRGSGGGAPSGKNEGCYKKRKMNLQYTDSSDTWFQDLKMSLKWGGYYSTGFSKPKNFP